jgi:hypothetical protein
MLKHNLRDRGASQSRTVIECCERFGDAMNVSYLRLVSATGPLHLHGMRPQRTTPANVLKTGGGTKR